MRKLATIAAVAVCATLLVSNAEAQRRDRDGGGPGGGGQWVDLGCKDVSFFGTDRDSIRVGRRDGRFKAIRLAARGNDVEMLDLKVIYANGEPDDIRVRSLIRQGTRTRPLDLRGRERSIDRIEMVYRKRLNFRGTATVCAEALG